MIKSALLFFWMVSTLILTFTIIGMLLFIPDGSYSKSSWMIIGNDLTQNINKTHSVILFICWIIFTIILTCSVFGMLLFLPDYYQSSTTWMKIGRKLMITSTY